MDVSEGSKGNAKFEEIRDLVIRPGYEIKNFQRDGWIVGKGLCDAFLSVLRNTCTTDSRGLMSTFEKWLREKFLDKQLKTNLNEIIVGKTVKELRKEYVGI